jgi:hypothetical protein
VLWRRRRRPASGSGGAPPLELARSIEGRALAIARDIVQGRQAPYEGAKALWWLLLVLEGDGPGTRDTGELGEALLGFLALAAQWEDDPKPKHRTEYESDIVTEAEGFIEQFGR